MIVRLTNGPLARMLHFALYERMETFARKLTPEVPAQGMVEDWLSRLYKDDPDLHILVALSEQYQLIAHAVVTVQSVGGVRVVVCHQTIIEKPRLDIFKEGMAYIDNLRRHEGAACSAVYLQKHTKAFERYGYKTVQVLMVKCSEDADTEDVSDDGENLIAEARSNNG